MAEVALPLRPILKSPDPTDEEVVRRIHQRIAEKPPWLPTSFEIPAPAGAAMDQA